MKQYRSEQEVKEALRELSFIIDTREQVNHHITEFLDNKKIPYKSRKLDVGDYSCQIDGMTFEESVVIERKASLDELAGNFTQGRHRFENEFLRAKARGTKVFLLIENASWADIKSHNYRSKMTPKALLASLFSWQVRYNISILFCNSLQTAEFMYGILYYWVKENL